MSSRMRRSNQEVAQLRFEVADDLLGQVVVQVAFGARQRVHEGAHLARGSAVHRGLDQLERRRPAVGPRLQVAQDVRLERVMVGVAE